MTGRFLAPLGRRRRGAKGIGVTKVATVTDKWQNISQNGRPLGVVYLVCSNRGGIPPGLQCSASFDALPFLRPTGLSSRPRDKKVEGKKKKPIKYL